jgi:hypothetical protein
MDITLKQFLEQADETHNLVINTHQHLNADQIKNKLYELESYIKQIQTVSHRIAKIYNVCKKKYNDNLFLKNLELQNIDPFPEKNSWSYLNRIPSSGKDLAPNIKVNARVVESCEDIPNTPLYWVKSLNQFAIHVNGVVLRGNIGNIYSNHSKNSEYGTNIKRCKHQNKCTFLLSGKKCRYYHEINDVYNLFLQKKISKNVYDVYLSMFRNYTNISWLYTNDVFKKQNKMMRFVGSRNTLKCDLDASKYRSKEWSSVYQGQMFHDFLIVMAMNQSGLIEGYPNVKIVSDDYSSDNPFVVKN